MHLLFLIAAATAAPCATPYRDVTIAQYVQPDYPQAARELGLGRVNVVVQVTVSPTGSVLGETISQSGGNMAIDQAALAAARQTQYAPKLVNCQPVTGDTQILFPFDPQATAMPRIVPPSSIPASVTYPPHRIFRVRPTTMTRVSCGSRNDALAVAQAIQAQMPPGAAVEHIVIAENFALALAYTPDALAARSFLLQKQSDWQVLTSEGGAFLLSTYQRYNVPPSVLQQLTAPAKCSYS